MKATFNSQALMENVHALQGLIKKIRQKESVGCDADELALHRAIHDIDMLLEIISTFKLQNASLEQ